MRLTDLSPEFLDAGGEGISDAHGQPVPHRVGVGVQFNCPCGCGRPCFVHFENPLDGGPSVSGPSPAWRRTGDTFDKMTLHPSILRSAARGGCGWHGWITNGDVTTC